MHKLKNILVAAIIVAMVSIAVYGVNKIANTITVAKDISLEEIKDCNTIYWNETENIYGTCTNNYNKAVCDDEPLNTSCHIEELSYTYSCVTGSRIVEKSKETCNDRELQLIIDKLSSSQRYKLTYGDWGKCSYTPGTDSVIIICDSKLDGNADGICQPGESCIGFIVSKNNVQRLFRNSRADFVEYDDTFYQENLDMEAIE